MPERRTINGELCERVERFEELHALDIVYDTACERPDCPRPSSCRSTLLKLREVEDDENFADIVDIVVWELLPPCYSPEPGYVSGLDAEMVAIGRIWRVVDEARDDDRDALENKIVENEAAIRAIWTSQIHPERIVKVRG